MEKKVKYIENQKHLKVGEALYQDQLIKLI
jgi:hypothetical protein